MFLYFAEIITAFANLYVRLITKGRVKPFNYGLPANVWIGFVPIMRPSMKYATWTEKPLQKVTTQDIFYYEKL